MKSTMSVYLLAGLAVIAGAIAGYYVGYYEGWKQTAYGNTSRVPMSFEECAAAGHPVMESYPRQCRTSDGRLFVEEIAVPPVPPSPATGSNDCVPAGCSGTICADADEAGNIVTTCEYRAEYACYRTAKCERQQNGKCGWTQTASLTSCLKNPPSLE